MAANNDNNSHGAEGVWPEFDPFMVLDDFADVLDIAGGLYSPPAAASMENVVTTGADGGNGYTSSVPADGSTPLAAASSTTTTASPGTNNNQDVATSSSPVHQGGLDCTGCHLLREVVHSNGFETMKLCIHGAAGVFYHAILEVYQAKPEGSALAPVHQSFVDFMGHDYVWVKNYLMDYAQQRATGGYTIMHDSTADFHDVLRTSMAGGIGLAHDDHIEVAESAVADNGVGDHQQVPVNAGDAIQPMIEQEGMPDASEPSQPNNAVEQQQQQDVRPGVRSRLTIQRERTKKLKLCDIARYFHLPLVKASKELRVGTTVLKNIKRKFGIKRWPYRSINAIDTKTADLRENGNESAETMDET